MWEGAERKEILRSQVCLFHTSVGVREEEDSEDSFVITISLFSVIYLPEASVAPIFGRLGYLLLSSDHVDIGETQNDIEN